MMVDCAILLCGLIFLRLGNSFPLLLIGRFLTGYPNGSNKTSILCYTSETNQPQIRNVTGTLFALFEQSGFAFIYILGAMFDWRFAVTLTMIWPILTFLLLIPCPQSPTWLLNKGRINEARAALVKLRGCPNIAEEELKRLVKNLEEQKENSKRAYVNSIWERTYRLVSRGTFLRPFSIIVVLYAVGLQWTGAPYLSFYLVYVIKKSSISVNPYWVSAGIFIYRIPLSLLSTLVSSKVPRRYLVLSTSLMLAIGAFSIGTTAYLSTTPWFLEYEESYPILKWLSVMSIGILYTGRVFCAISYTSIETIYNLCFKSPLITIV